MSDSHRYFWHLDRSRHEWDLKFGDSDGPKLFRVKKVDVSSTFIENIFRSGLTLVSFNDNEKSIGFQFSWKIFNVNCGFFITEFSRIYALVKKEGSWQNSMHFEKRKRCQFSLCSSVEGSKGNCIVNQTCHCHNRAVFRSKTNIEFHSQTKTR